MEKPKRITPEKFDEMLDRIINNGYPIKNWYPNMEDVKEIEANPIKYYEFMIWILESNPDRELTEEEKEVEKRLHKILRDYTAFIEG